MASADRPAIMLLALLMVSLAIGCTPPSETPVAEEPAPQEPVESTEGDLLGELRDADYQDWQPAPGYEQRQPAEGPHGEEVRILLDPTAAQALTDGAETWPVDTIIAKDIYRDGQLIQIAAMKKVDKGWYWGEWDADGGPVIQEGVGVEPCEGCHADGDDGTLGVSLRQ